MVLLQNGRYGIRNQVRMKSNVVLRGESRGQTWIDIGIKFEGASEPVKTEAFFFNDVRRAGLEDLSVTHPVFVNGRRAYPLDHDWTFDTWFKYELRSQNYQNERVYTDRANFEYSTVRDLDVNAVKFEGTTEDSWMDNVALRNVATNGVIIGNKTKHITLRDNVIIGAFQKGSNGHGYGINCSGDYVLMTGNNVSKVRHWAIQQGAAYTVTIKNVSGTDINFHQGDGGNNLVEDNRIHIPEFHLWPPFSAGASFHNDPGTANVFWNNDVIDRGNGRKYGDNRVYTFVGKDVVAASTPAPRHGTFYAVKRGGTAAPAPAPAPAPSGGNTTVNLNATEYKYDLGTPRSPVQRGWTRLTPDATGDIRWSDKVIARDRGAGGGVNAINQDHIESPATRTLRHRLKNGRWRVVLNMGDKSYPHDNMVVEAEGKVVADDVDAAKGQYTYVVFTADVRDGWLDLKFSDRGGVNGWWAVTRLSMTRQ